MDGKPGHTLARDRVDQKAPDTPPDAEHSEELGHIPGKLGDPSSAPEPVNSDGEGSQTSQAKHQNREFVQPEDDD